MNATTEIDDVDIDDIIAHGLVQFEENPPLYDIRAIMAFQKRNGIRPEDMTHEMMEMFRL